MFKVHENGDGSTSIFCNKTGKLICKIGAQQRNMGLGCRPVNVIEPSPNNRCCFNIETKSESEDLQTVSDEEKPDIKIEECDFPIYDEPEEEDFPYKDISSEDFARCLNLVSTEKFKNEPIADLKSTFPLRLLSRTKALPGDIKFPEELPITSSMGLKVLKANEQKNFFCDQTIEMKIKAYETFCRFQISTYGFNHPNLRCRDKKEYPITFPPKNSKCATAHTYAFNKRQRMENLITIRTGLNTQSRKLLLSCNKRLAVSIKRLPDDEIKYWMQKRARLGPIPADLIRGEDSSLMGSDSDVTVVDHNYSTYVDIDLYSDESSAPSDNDDPPYRCKMKRASNFKKRFGSHSAPQRNRIGQNPKRFLNYFDMYRRSCVVLSNVLYSLRRCHSGYYVSGTNIKVPFFKDFFNSLDSKTRKRIVIPETKFIINSCYMPQYDHAYHRPFSSAVADRKRKLLSNSDCLNHKNSKTKTVLKNDLKQRCPVKNKSLKPNSSHSVKSNSSLSKQIAQIAVIPLIDLTISPPNSPRKPKGNCSYCVFKCYGCGYNTRSPTELDAKFVASQHLKVFHCVSDPKSFLNINNTSSEIVLEAFPGYKKDSVG